MLFDRTCLLSVTRTCREGENERGERERQRGRERLGERGRETEKVFDRTCLLHASAWSVSGLSLSDGGGKRETEREVDRHSRNLNTRHERDCECKVLSSESWCGRERLWERAASAMADEWRDVHRSYGRRIQSKIVKRCPGGIDSMPTAEQAMMRMLQVRCAIVCVSVCGWQSACAARALLCVCRSACLCGLRAVLCIGGCCPTVLSYCVYCPPSRLTTNPMKSLTFTRACPLVQDSGVDNAASLTAHEMMERVTQQVTAARYMPQAPLGCTRLPHTAHRTQHTAHSTLHSPVFLACACVL